MTRYPISRLLMAGLLVALAMPATGQEPASRLQAAESALRRADQNLSEGNFGTLGRVDLTRALAAVRLGQQAVDAARGRAEDRLVQNADRELAEARRLIESDNAELTQVVDEIRGATEAVAALNRELGGATGAPAGTAPATIGGAGR